MNPDGVGLNDVGASHEEAVFYKHKCVECGEVFYSMYNGSQCVVCGEDTASFTQASEFELAALRGEIEPA